MNVSDYLHQLLSPLYAELLTGPAGIILLNISRFFVVFPALLLCTQYRERGYWGESLLVGLLALWVLAGALSIEQYPVTYLTPYPLGFNLLLCAFFTTKYLRHNREENEKEFPNG